MQDQQFQKCDTFWKQGGNGFLPVDKGREENNKEEDDVIRPRKPKGKDQLPQNLDEQQNFGFSAAVAKGASPEVVSGQNGPMSSNQQKMPFEEDKHDGNEMKEGGPSQYRGDSNGFASSPPKPSPQNNPFETPGGPTPGQHLEGPQKQEIDDLCEMFLKKDGDENDLLTREDIAGIYEEMGFDSAFDRLLIFVEEIEQEQVIQYCFQGDQCSDEFWLQ